MMPHAALIMIDLQNDFCPGGSLAVPEGNAVISLANRLQSYFELIIATQDWHPKDHSSFASHSSGHSLEDLMTVNKVPQAVWPAHCVQNTRGAEFHPQLQTSRIQKIIFKGVDKKIDSYSAFFDNAHLRSTELADYLNGQNIHTIYLIGLATDYCVKYSCLDALQLGFKVVVIADACRGIDLKPGDSKQALQEMAAAGATVMDSNDFFQIHQIIH